MLTDAKVERIQSTIARSFIDEVVIRRPANTADAEGNAAAALAVVVTTVGRWGSPTPAELQSAAQAGQRLDAMLTIADNHDVRGGDLVDVRAHRWRVGTVTVSRFQQKLHLVRVDR